MNATAKHGRKYGLTYLGLWLGFVGLVLAFGVSYRRPEIQGTVSTLYLAYAGIISLTISVFNGAAAYEGKEKATVTTTTTASV